MKKRTDDVFARAALVAAAAVFAAGAAHGIDVTFSKENGDLALPADWGMESLPDSTNRIAFAASGSAMTATASADISYAGIIPGVLFLVDILCYLVAPFRVDGCQNGRAIVCLRKAIAEISNRTCIDMSSVKPAWRYLFKNGMHHFSFSLFCIYQAKSFPK